MICRVVAVAPATTGSIGTPARAYSSLRLSDRAQKCGGVQRKMMRNRLSGSSPISPVAAAQPITGGARQQRRRLRCSGRAPLQPDRIHDDVKEHRKGEKPGRPDIEHQGKNHHCRGGKCKPKDQCLLARHSTARDGAHGGAPIRASMSASYHMLRTPAAPAPSRLPGWQATQGVDRDDLALSPFQRMQ